MAEMHQRGKVIRGHQKKERNFFFDRRSQGNSGNRGDWIPEPGYLENGYNEPWKKT
jgi:hypothetical protein